MNYPPHQADVASLFQVLNLGAGDSESFGELISLIEENLDIEAIKNYVAGPRGEMLETLADTELTKIE